MQKSTKRILIVVGIIVMIWLFMNIVSAIKFLIRGTINRSSTDIEEYSNYLKKVVYSEEYMPMVEELGHYTEFQVNYKKTMAGVIFETRTIGVFLTYEEEEFQKQYDYIMEHYQFFDTSQKNKEGVDCFAQSHGYEIKMVDREYRYEIYKTALLIGIDEENKKICYLYFSDSELDVLDDLDEFVDLYFLF